MMSPMVSPRSLARVTSALTLAVVAFAALLVTTLPARAKTASKSPPRYYVQLTTVTFAEGVIADEALVIPTVKAKAEAALAAQPQFVTVVEGAPAESATDAEWKKWLGKQKLAGALKVNLVVTTAHEDAEPDPAKKGQKYTTDLAVTLFGETVPARVMAFTGEGAATIRLEVGKKLLEADRRYAWEEAATEAMNKAITASLAKLSEKATKAK
jgi:hypothetical protein